MKYRNWRAWVSRKYIIFLLLVMYYILPTESKAIPLQDKREINLMIVHSFEQTLPDYKDFNKRVTENLKNQKLMVNTNVFYLDCDAFDREDEIQRINHHLDTIYCKPDIILVTDDQATYSLLASKHPLLKTIPIVFSGVNFPNWELMQEYTNITGILDYPDYEKNIDMIEKLMGAKHVRFFYDKTYNGKRVLERLAGQYINKDEELYQSLTGFLQNDTPLDNEDAVETTHEYLKSNTHGERPLKTSIHFINMWDDLGRNLLWNISGTFKHSVFLLTKYDYATAKVGRLATIPTFSTINKGFSYNQDILGGYFTSLEDQVNEACNYITRLARGEQVSQLPFKEAPKKYLLDWTILNRWNIPTGNVPKEFEIINIPVYVKYKTEAIAILAILVLLITFTITYLLFLYRREAKRKRQAQLKLWEEKEFLSLAIEGSNIFAWKYNHENNEFIFDKEFLDTVGGTSETITLKELAKKTHPEEMEHAINALISVANGIEDRGDVKARVDFNGQGYVWYEFRFLNISGILGDESSVIGLLMNIQNYKNTEQELIRARDLASKAELKQSFLANMSHEIRTPLNAIVGFSNILVIDEELPNEDKLEYIRIINKNCELLLKLINDILEISRIESGNMSFTLESCYLNDIIEDVYGMCFLQNPANVQFSKNIPEESLCIETDIMRLKQVLVNLVNNAFKFTSSGHIVIGTDIDETKQEVSLYVEDTGAGIPETHQKMIFERFYKVDEFAQGTGLGLSICQVIANKLNGRITLSSEVGKGSRFSIVLPYVKKHDSAPSEDEKTYSLTEETPDAQEENKPVVLIAEDSVNNYMVLNNILKKTFTIIWAVNGKDVLEIVKKRKVDLILMDIKMHEMDGLTALAKLRKNFKNLPVIIQTAYAFDDNRKLAKQAGASDFISKPISPETLWQVIGNFIPIDRKK